WSEKMGKERTKKRAEKGRQQSQKNPPKKIKKKERFGGHRPNTRHDRSEGSDHGDETGNNDGKSAVPIIEFFGRNKMFAVEQKRILVCKNFRTRRVAYPITHCITYYCCRTQGNIQSQ